MFTIFSIYNTRDSETRISAIYIIHCCLTKYIDPFDRKKFFERSSVYTFMITYTLNLRLFYLRVGKKDYGYLTCSIFEVLKDFVM